MKYGAEKLSLKNRNEIWSRETFMKLSLKNRNEIWSRETFIKKYKSKLSLKNRNENLY